MQNAKCNAEYSNGILILKLSGDIDHHSAKELREEIDSQIFLYRASTVMLDLSNIDFMDSSGLGLILGRYAKIKELGGVLVITDPNEGVLKILKLAGTEKMIKIKYTERTKSI